jgi:peptidylprolyl isomerase
MMVRYGFALIAFMCLLLDPQAGLSQPASQPAAKGAVAGNILVVETTKGGFKIEMLPALAPKHVARIKELVSRKFYDGVRFHRVIEGFMAQTGDPTGTGTGGSGKKIPAEFSETPHERGTVSMARAEDPNSADSQFFICYDDVPSLNGKYTVWGRVIAGMENVDKLNKGSRDNNGMVPDPDKILTIRIADRAN